MEAAKSAVNKILSMGGHHETHVEETVNPAVTQETVKPTRHENITEAVDKEVHQDHYHTTVQPLQHQEVLPEQHQHNQLPVQEKVFSHGDDSNVSRSVNDEAAQFRDSSRIMATTQSQSQAPTVAGERVHHHVHETVQPVIQKETIAPEVVHTTVPIHERHQAPSEQHGMSVLPTKTLSEMGNTGHSLTSGSHRTEHYEGDPRHYNASMQADRTDADTDFAKHDGLHGIDTSNPAKVGTIAATGTGHHEHGSTSGAGLGGTSHQEHRLTSGSGVGGISQHDRGLTSGTGIGGTGHQEHGLTSGSGTSGSTVLGGTGQQEYGTTQGISGRSPAHDITTDGSTNTSTSHGLGTGHTGHQSQSQSQSQSHHTIESNTTGSNTHSDGLTSHTGHGTSNQLHHGTARDNIDPNTHDDNKQHGSQPRDPALVEDKSDKKLTGTGVDGSHSALFGLTPDGHKHEETSSAGLGSLLPAHSKHGGRTQGAHARGQEKLAEQMQDMRVSEGAHGQNTSSYDTGSNKPGAGMVGGSQGFGNIRPEEHGTASKLENKLDPSTDADGDGKKGLMD